MLTPAAGSGELRIRKQVKEEEEEEEEEGIWALIFTSTASAAL